MKVKGKIKKWTPPALLLFSIILNLLARVYRPFGEYYVNHIFPLWVETYGRLTGLFSFSVGEWMLYLAAALVLFLAAGGVVYLLSARFRKRAVQTGFQRFFPKYAFFLYWVGGIVCLIMTLNCFLLYQTPLITERYAVGGGSRQEYGTEELAVLRDQVVEQANELAVTFTRDENGRILYQGDLRAEAVKQMQRLGETFDALKGYYPEPKGLWLSGFYSQQYIMGYYFPFSMEANYNRQMYVTNMPVTMCHELSHLKGFIREDEANFIGYLACIDSEDPLFRYSACLSVINYLDRDFIRSIGGDAEVYLAHPQISEQVEKDNIFLTEEAWQQVEESSLLKTETVRQAADTFLNTTLTLNGVADGTGSYSRVVDLLLKYYDGILY